MWFIKRKKENKRVSMIAAAVIRANLSGPPVEAHVLNISYGGAGIYVKEPLTGKVQIVINLTVAAGKQKAETVSGKVIWKRPVGSWYVVGVSFDGLDNNEHTHILSFLDRALGCDSHGSESLNLIEKLRANMKLLK
jgi:c-di-GMP-binding flagellar brake protein YcgR